MWSLLSYLGVSLQSELCMWILLGTIRSTFDATIFRINANLKQVWSMKMPGELALSVQRGLRTMVSGVVLVQCFTAHLHLASYIVLLYPVFLEERPALVLPWLLVSAVRRLLCELLALSMGLTSCLLVGAARVPCVVFVLRKLASVVSALYMWILVYNYYQSLKMLRAFRTFSTDTDVPDYGFELAVRRRQTKSLLAETELRRNLTRGQGILPVQSQPNEVIIGTSYSSGRGLSISIPHKQDLEEHIAPLIQLSISPQSSTTTFEEWINSDLPPRRNVDRILDQFVVMILKVSAYVSTKTSQDHISWSRLCLNIDQTSHPPRDTKGGRALTGAEPETPSQVGSGVREGPSYLREFPLIFNKRRINSNFFGTFDPRLMSANPVGMWRDDSIQTDSGSTDLSLQSTVTSSSEKKL